MSHLQKKREREGSTLHPTTRNASNTNYRCKCGVILPPNKEGDLCDYPYLLKVVHAATPLLSQPPSNRGWRWGGCGSNGAMHPSTCFRRFYLLLFLIF